ncbi:hypothetical protein PBI_SUZY_34 [Gordonia phage Suzy]|uniref:Uncharacterized protein n=1 Tax=Gordonia phage Suzy TaxID=2201430 RepID=A0A2Z4Q8N7_9CAUD|nr:hypothetical protein HOT44_gp34 [Gordonia phage Suzy]AWY06139.1 hypothetical protein PBI_SUZY_34 [Gordonia phage Suzy]
MSENTAAIAPAAAEAARPKADVYVAPKGHNPDKDWSYIADKEPLETHELFAQIIRRKAGIEISAKQVQALLLMHRWMQASDLNRERETFRGRTLGSVIRGAETQLGRSENRATMEGEDAQVVQVINSVGDEVAEAIRAELTAPVVEQVEEPEVDFRTAPKAALVSMVVEQELAPEADAKKLTVKKLRALLSGEEA